MQCLKKSLLFTIYIVDNKITCIRCNLTGKFVSIKKYLAKQKANVILSNAKANKPNSGYLSIVIMFLLIAIAYSLCYSVIIERQVRYNEVNNSSELFNNYYNDCSTDSDCEQIEAQLNFDFKKGMN